MQFRLLGNTVAGMESSEDKQGQSRISMPIASLPAEAKNPSLRCTQGIPALGRECLAKLGSVHHHNLGEASNISYSSDNLDERCG